MNCPECGWPVPDNALGCRSCLAKRALSDALDLAAARVPDIASGRLQVRLWRKAKYTERHITLPNYSTHAWCGADISEHGFVDFKTLPEAIGSGIRLCVDCVDAINKLIKVER